MLDGHAKRIAWVTDPHLNFVPHDRWLEFANQLATSHADMILLGGDISEADDFAWQVQRLEEATGKQIAFVLGNHDFYRGSIDGARAAASAISDYRRIAFLTGGQPIQLSPRWTLIGDDCPADSRSGDVDRSPVQMNDFHLIEEFRGLWAADRNAVLRQLGSEAASRLGRQLACAAKMTSSILVLTHVPPLREACWHEGQATDDDWAPFFVCQAAGDCLVQFAAENPGTRVLVLCGHTHSGGIAKITENLEIRTGGALYGEPQITEMLDLAAI